MNLNFIKIILLYLLLKIKGLYRAFNLVFCLYFYFNFMLLYDLKGCKSSTINDLFTIDNLFEFLIIDNNIEIHIEYYLMFKLVRCDSVDEFDIGNYLVEIDSREELVYLLLKCFGNIIKQLDFHTKYSDNIKIYVDLIKKVNN